MTDLLNVLWFVLGGFALAGAYLVLALVFYLTIIGAPFGRAMLELAKLSAFPFGKELKYVGELEGNKPGIAGPLRLILNIVWFPFGIVLTIAHILVGIVYIATIVGAPIGIYYLKLGRFLVAPIGIRVVPKTRG